MIYNTSTIVQKLWNPACLASLGADKHCNVLRDDLSAFRVQAGGMSYGDYVEQFTYQHYSEMSKQQTMLPYRMDQSTAFQGARSEHSDTSSEHYRLGSEHSESGQTEKLLAIAAPVREKPRVAKVLVEEIILALCSEDWRTLRTLAGLLGRGRDTDSLRNHYINPMLKDGRLIARVPGNPNHPNQAYKKKPE